MGSNFDFEQYFLNLLGLGKNDICCELVHDIDLIIDNRYDHQKNTIKQSMHQVQNMKYEQGYITRSVQKIPYGNSFCCILTESYDIDNGMQYDIVKIYDLDGYLIEN